MVADFAEKIDLTNTNQILHYGSAAQQKLPAFPSPRWRRCERRTWEIGDAITGLVTELKRIFPRGRERLLGCLSAPGNKLEAMKPNTIKRKSALTPDGSGLRCRSFDPGGKGAARGYGYDQ